MITIAIDSCKTTLQTCAFAYKITGKERDAESGLDYFGARYYASSMGRFMSPDWSAKAEPVPYARMDNPQTLNLYAYVGNNPIGSADPDGHCGLYNDGGCSTPPPQESGDASGASWLDLTTTSMVEATARGKAEEEKKEQEAQQQSAKSQAAQIPGAVKAAIMSSLNDSDAPSFCGCDFVGGFHEESGIAGTNAAGALVISPDLPGQASDPDTSNHVSTTHTPVDQGQRNSMTSITVAWHIHPSGTTATHGWAQPPSAADQRAVISGAINLVVGAGNSKVYFYNGTSNVQSMSLKNFMKP